MATLCILLSLALGVASAVSCYRIEGQNHEKRVDAATLTALLVAGSLVSFLLAIWFALVAVVA